MSERARSPAPPSNRRGDAEKAGSGQHPAVQAYRAKLESIERGAEAATSDLDRRLEEFLTDLRTPVPPKL